MVLLYDDKIKAMKFSLSIIKTVYKLGICNVMQVLYYRIKKRTGINLAQGQKDSVLNAPFFKEIDFKREENIQPATNGIIEMNYFGWFRIPVSNTPPDWHYNFLTKKRADDASKWWKISDFQQDVGDIKAVYELSRFGWVLTFSQHALLGHSEKLTQLNDWLADWCYKNPAYRGVNWKCGQEAAIRVMHLAMAAVLLRQIRHSTPSLLKLIILHLSRIESTIGYALAQDNNHGISEAAALYIGGSWLECHGRAIGIKWKKLGCKLLEKQVKRLIAEDGSSSQYSVNYHRAILDTLCMVEVWRVKNNLPLFSNEYQSRVVSAIFFMTALTDPVTGDAPTIGAYDGARLLCLTDGDRDFRTTIQLAIILFTKCRVYAEDGLWNLPVQWLEIPLPEHVVTLDECHVFNKGGFAVLNLNKAKVVMHYPCFRFRPSQADILHVDFWKDGNNIFRDAGTYSYNASIKWLNYFSGTTSHNTIVFDKKDQMPRLSRFLFIDWLKTDSIEPLIVENEKLVFAAAYKDKRGCYHKRRLILLPNKVQIIDEIRGFKESAILRWRLLPGSWCVEDNKIKNGRHMLTINATMPIRKLELVDGWESRHYLQKTWVPVVEVEVFQPGEIFSEYQWLPEKNEGFGLFISGETV